MTDVASIPSRGTLRNVQALRAIAALMVVLVHATLPFVGIEDVLRGSSGAWLSPFQYAGLAGVDLFFVISGFIMLVTNWNSFSRPLAGARFFLRRAIRIYPPYWLALLPILAILIFAKDRFMVSHVGVRTGILESILLLPQPNHFVLTVAWTLVWELIFYVIFAAILQFPRKFVYAALGGWLVAELIMHATLADSSNFYLQFASAPLPLEFIGGTAIGLLYVHRRMPGAVLIAGLAVVLAALFWSSVAAAQLVLDPGQLLRVVAFGIPAMLLVYAAVALENRGLLVAPHWLAAIGDGSYAIYLWHLSVLVVLRQLIVRLPAGGPLLHAAVIIITLAIIITVGMAVYRFFERPVTTYLNGLLAIQMPVRTPVAPLRPRTVSGGGGE